jgi:Uma2 family endonuclease
MTSDEFCDLPVSESAKLQLLDSKVMVTEWPTVAHQNFVAELTTALNSWSAGRRLGWAIPATLVQLAEGWTPVPDVSFVTANRRKCLREQWIEGPPDLTAEVLSPSDRKTDRETKFAAYARFGVRWYWIVDLKKRTLEECEAVNGVYTNKVRVPFDQPFSPRLFPGLTMDLASFEW